MCIQERQLRVIEDMVVCPADPVLGSAYQQVPVMPSTLPPLRQVQAGLAELQPLSQLWVMQDLFSNFAQ